MKWLSITQELIQQNNTFAIATIFDVGGSAPREIGAKIIVQEDGAFHETLGGGEFEKQVIDQSLQCIQEKKNGIFSYPLGAKTAQCCGGVVEVAIEVFHQFYPNLFIFGAGHVGQAIANALHEAPLSLTILDPRQTWLDKVSALKTVNIKHLENPITNVDHIPKKKRQSCVVLTHSHELDFELINALIQQPEWSYVGLIGSQSKWTRFQRRLQENGRTQDEIDKITCPIGIPLNGKTPAEIAISFGAQILQVLYN